MDRLGVAVTHTETPRTLPRRPAARPLPFEETTIHRPLSTESAVTPRIARASPRRVCVPQLGYVRRSPRARDIRSDPAPEREAPACLEVGDTVLE